LEPTTTAILKAVMAVLPSGTWLRLYTEAR
jgi:hypothetical protein